MKGRALAYSSDRQVERSSSSRYQCGWCAVVRECPPEKQMEYKARVFFSMAKDIPHSCPDHEPLWYKGIEGCRP